MDDSERILHTVAELDENVASPHPSPRPSTAGRGRDVPPLEIPVAMEVRKFEGRSSTVGSGRSSSSYGTPVVSDYDGGEEEMSLDDEPLFVLKLGIMSIVLRQCNVLVLKIIVPA